VALRRAGCHGLLAIMRGGEHLIELPFAVQTP
jgi:hypothetical protein